MPDLFVHVLVYIKEKLLVEPFEPLFPDGRGELASGPIELYQLKQKIEYADGWT